MTQDELRAAGAALCLVAATFASPASRSRKDKATMARLANMSAELLTSLGLTPTEMKDLGLRLISESMPG